MATSGTIEGSCTGGSGGKYDFWAYWKRNSYSVENATSNITIYLRVQRNDGYNASAYNLNSKPSVTIKVGGSSKSPTINYIDTRNDAVCTFATWTGNVSHKDDGSLKLAIEASFTHSGSSSLTGGSLSGSASIDSIPRASVPTVSSSSATMKGSVTIKTNRYSDSFTHTLKCKFGSYSGTIATGVGASYKWTVPDLSSYCKDSDKGTATITCVTYKGSTEIGTKTVTMTINVPSASVPTLSVSEVYMGGSGVTIYTNKKASAFRHTVKVYFEGSVIATYEKEINQKVYHFSLDLASKIPSATEGKAYVTCTTYNGTKQIGSVQKTGDIKVKVPENDTTRPKVNGVTLSPSVAIQGFDGMFIQGKTGVKCDFDATTKYSNGLTYSMKVNGKTYTGDPAKSSTLYTTGRVIVECTVTDARGYFTKVAGYADFVDYTRPTIDIIKCERCLQNGTPSDTGTYVHIKVKRSYSSVNGKNSCSVKYQYKTDTGNYSSPVYITSYADGGDYISPNEVFRETGIYTVNFIIDDLVSEAQDNYFVKIPAVGCTYQLAEGGRRISVGRYVGDALDRFYVGWDGQFDENVYIGKNLYFKKGDEYIPSDTGWISLGLSSSVSDTDNKNGRYGKGCAYRVVNGNHVYVSFNCKFDFEGSGLRVNLNDIPSEYRPKNYVYALCPTMGRSIARVYVSSLGDVMLEWYQYITATASTTSASMDWVDGYIDYFI